jgi:hypothetical protein
MQRTPWAARLRRLRERLRDDRGSLSMAVVIWTPIVMILCAFVVNTGFLISDREKANDLAEQAARRVADQIDPVVLAQGNGVLRIDIADGSTDCGALAKSYFTDNAGTDPQLADVDTANLTCTVTNNPTAQGVLPQAGQPTTIKVTIQMAHKTLLTGVPIANPSSIVATGTATPIRTPIPVG